MRNTFFSLLAIGIFTLFMMYACQPNVSIETAQYAVNGQKLYRTHCENCHGAQGEGLGTLYPPLTDSSYLRTNREKLACIVRNGLNEPVQVNGKTFEGSMPGLPQLSAIEIAYILTYVTTNFGQQTSTYSQEDVRKSLANCP